MVDFAALKKNRSKSLDKLNDQLSKVGSKNFSNADDDKYWKLTRDAAGNGMAIIRFLPAPGEEDMPFQRIWDHGFQGPTGKWYIENSRTTLGPNTPDPASEYNTRLWNSGIESDKKQAQLQKRRLHFISNIYVVSDPSNPENNGKVFLYKYGKKIFEKLNDLMNPSFADEKPVNPFDLWEGSNFRLKIRVVEGYPNYDKSEFDDSAPLFSDDDKLETVWKQEHSLVELIDPKHFKPYDELKAKFYAVLGLDGGTTNNAAKRVEDVKDEELDMSSLGKTAKEPEPKAKVSAPTVDEDDDDLEFFKALTK